MKDPKFIVQQSGNSQQQSKSQPRLSSPGGAPQVPAPVPAGNQWVVPPMKRKRISISIMPREAGGGGLTAANTVSNV